MPLNLHPTAPKPGAARTPLAASDRKMIIVIGAIALVLALAVVFLVPQKEEDPGFPSSYSPHSHGAKAAFLLLKETGYNVERWTKSPNDLPEAGAGTVLVVANPLLPPENDERDALKRYVLRGGRVLAIGQRASWILPRENVAGLDVPQTEWHEIPPALPSRLTRGGPVKAEQYVKWKPDAGDLVHYASADGPFVISYAYGKGEVIWWASTTPITNAGVRESGNLDLLLNCIGPNASHIYWDEFFHGSRRGLWTRVSDTPLKWLLWQTGAFALALLFTYSRRRGPIHPLVVESRLSPLEFVETLGGLYKRARASGFAVEVAYGRFRHLLTRRLGLQRDLASDALARAAHTRLRYDEPSLAPTLAECETAVSNPDLEDKDALRLVRELNRHARALKLVVTPAHENRVCWGPQIPGHAEEKP